MKRSLAVVSLALVSISCAAWQLSIPLSGSRPGNNDSPKSVPSNQRTLTGVVTDRNDQPISHAVVYLKNQKTLNVRTVFPQKDGTYRFTQLERNVDYEVYAESDGRRSDSKTVSQFDDRSAPRINLKINLNK
jgi:hypothetical protein